MSVLLVFVRFHSGLEVLYRGSLSFERCLWPSPQLPLAPEISLWTFFSPPLPKLTIRPADGEPGSVLKQSVLTALSSMPGEARQQELCSCPLKENVAHPGLVRRMWIP